MARRFKDNPDYVLVNSRYHRVSSSTTSSSPSRLHDEIKKESHRPHDDYHRVVDEIVSLSLDIEDELRDDYLGQSDWDMDFDEFISYYDTIIDEDNRDFSDLDDALIDFVDTYGYSTTPFPPQT